MSQHHDTRLSQRPPPTFDESRRNLSMFYSKALVGFARVRNNCRRAFAQCRIDVPVAIGRLAAHGDKDIANLHVPRVILNARHRRARATPLGTAQRLKHMFGIHRAHRIAKGSEEQLEAAKGSTKQSCFLAASSCITARTALPPAFPPAPSSLPLEPAAEPIHYPAAAPATLRGQLLPRPSAMPHPQMKAPQRALRSPPPPSHCFEVVLQEPSSERQAQRSSSPLAEHPTRHWRGTHPPPSSAATASRCSSHSNWLQRL